MYCDVLLRKNIAAYFVKIYYSFDFSNIEKVEKSSSTAVFFVKRKFLFDWRFHGIFFRGN